MSRKKGDHQLWIQIFIYLFNFEAGDSGQITMNTVW